MIGFVPNEFLMAENLRWTVRAVEHRQRSRRLRSLGRPVESAIAAWEAERAEHNRDMVRAVEAAVREVERFTRWHEERTAVDAL